MKRKERVRLIDLDALAIGRTTHNRAPDAWFRSPEHLVWIRTLPCAFTGKTGTPDLPIQACHVRKGTDGALSEKPSDVFVWPGSDREHRTQHFIGEVTFFAQRNIQDPALWAVKNYALRSPCPKTVAAAGRWLEGKPIIDRVAS